MQQPYPSEFEAFVSAARKHPHLWRLLAGVCVSALVYAAWAGAVSAVYGWTAGQAPTLTAGLAPGDVYVLLVSAFGLALGAAVAVRLLHHRPVGSLLGPLTTVLRDFVFAAALAGAVQCVALALQTMVYDVEFGMDVSVWLLLLPLSLLGVLVQTGAEELAFRGYLQQQLAARFRSPLVWLLVPGLAFGLAHYSPAISGGNAWLVVFAAICFGLAAADLTARTGSIGAAWGFHFVGNTAALLAVGLKDMVHGLALFVTPFSAKDSEAGLMIAFDLLALATAWLLVRHFIRR